MSSFLRSLDVKGEKENFITNWRYMRFRLVYLRWPSSALKWRNGQKTPIDTDIIETKPIREIDP